MSDTDATRREENVGTGFIVVATAFGALAVLAFQAVASRTLGTDGFAPIAVLWTVMFLIYTVLMLPAEQHLTRALVVTRDRLQIRRVRRAMLGAFALAMVVSVVFVALTLDRFFDGAAMYVAITAGIMVSRSLMATGRGALAGHRRFGGYAATIAMEAGALLVGGLAMAFLDAPALAFGWAMAVAPLATLLTRPFAPIEGHGDIPDVDAQSGSFLIWLITATAASQLIIAGGPIAVSFVGGTAAAVSIFFTSFALLRGPVTSAYNLVARVLPDFTALAHGDDPYRLWRWAPRITASGFALAVVGAIGSGLLLRPLIEAIYGEAFVPPTLAAILGGAGVGLGLGALFVTQVYSAAAKGAVLAFGWLVALGAAVLVLAVSTLAPIERVALAFVVGEGVGLVALGLVLPRMVSTVPGSSR
jgi:O-antigen/teichoic acid export membrane protein